jgi:hypothetical protein
MSSVTFQLASQLEEAFNAVGASMMSDEFAGKLLAYVYVMGGGNEAFIHELERKGENTPWLERIYSRYNLKRPNVKKNGK